MESQLFNAVEDERIKPVRTILSLGANVNMKNSTGNTLLHVAVVKQSIEILNLLIDFEADVNLKNNNSETAMSIALDYDSPLKKCAILRLLVEAGADVNTTGKRYGDTALHQAVQASDISFILLLINQGAEVNACNHQLRQLTPLHYAAKYVNSEDPTVFEILLAAGAEVDHAENDSKTTPLHILAKKSAAWSLSKIVRVFLKYGADFKAKDRFFFTPMDYAIDYRNTEAVKAFILCGKFDVNCKVESQYSLAKTTLHEACSLCDLHTVKFLLKNDADVNALDGKGKSPLYRLIHSVEYDDDEIADLMEVLEYLLKKWNPDVNTITNSGQNILTPEIDDDYELPDNLWQAILLHLAKLNASNRPIHPSLVKTISSKPKYEEYFEMCNQELELMKNTKLHSESWITFFNLLVDDERRLVQYMGNANLVKVLLEAKIKDKFPLYKALIYERFLKAARKRIIWDKAADLISTLFPKGDKVNSEHSVVLKILSFFKLKDLEKLCQ